MDELKVFVPYDELMRLKEDSANLESVKKILVAEFPDDTCQIIAIKSILGITDEVEEPTDPSDPTDSPSDPTDPPTP